MGDGTAEASAARPAGATLPEPTEQQIRTGIIKLPGNDLILNGQITSFEEIPTLNDWKRLFDGKYLLAPVCSTEEFVENPSARGSFQAGDAPAAGNLGSVLVISPHTKDGKCSEEPSPVIQAADAPKPKQYSNPTRSIFSDKATGKENVAWLQGQLNTTEDDILYLGMARTGNAEEGFQLFMVADGMSDGYSKGINFEKEKTVAYTFKPEDRASIFGMMAYGNFGSARVRTVMSKGGYEVLLFDPSEEDVEVLKDRLTEWLTSDGYEVYPMPADSTIVSGFAEALDDLNFPMSQTKHMAAVGILFALGLAAVARTGQYVKGTAVPIDDAKMVVNALRRLIMYLFRGAADINSRAPWSGGGGGGPITSLPEYITSVNNLIASGEITAEAGKKLIEKARGAGTKPWKAMREMLSSNPALRDVLSQLSAQLVPQMMSMTGATNQAELIQLLQSGAISPEMASEAINQTVSSIDWSQVKSLSPALVELEVVASELESSVMSATPKLAETVTTLAQSAGQASSITQTLASGLHSVADSALHAMNGASWTLGAMLGTNAWNATAEAWKVYEPHLVPLHRAAKRGGVYSFIGVHTGLASVGTFGSLASVEGPAAIAAAQNFWSSSLVPAAAGLVLFVMPESQELETKPE